MSEVFMQLGLFFGSLFLCFLVFYISLNFFPLLTRNVDLRKQLDKNNLGLAILTGSFVVSVTVLLYFSSKNIFILFSEYTTINNWMFSLLRAFFMFLLSMFIAFLVNWFVMKAFVLAPFNIDEMKELRNNNLTVSLLMTSMVIMTTYWISEPLNQLNSAFLVQEISNEMGTQSSFINLNQFLSSMVELVVLLLTSILLFLLGISITGLVVHGFVQFVEFKRDNLNLAAIVCSSILSVMIMIKYSITTHTRTLGNIVNMDANIEILLAIARFGFVTLVATIISILVLWLCMGMFLYLSKMFDIKNGIRQSNDATAFILSIFTFSASFMIRIGVRALVKLLTFF